MFRTRKIGPTSISKGDHCFLFGRMRSNHTQSDVGLGGNSGDRFCAVRQTKSDRPRYDCVLAVSLGGSGGDH